jgi:hypothetical protein
LPKIARRCSVAKSGRTFINRCSRRVGYFLLAKRQTYETLAICSTLALARAAFDVAVADKPAGRFMIRSRTRVVQQHRDRRAASRSSTPLSPTLPTAQFHGA